MAPLTAGVAALIGGVLMLAKGPSVMTKPEVGLFVGGTLALGVGLMFVPSKKRTETKQVYTAATIDPDGSTWRSCGERTPEQAAIDLRFSGGWKSFTESVQTGMDGRYTLEGELLEDVLTWSGACQQELTMAVDLPKTGDTTADALRAREGEIATDPGAPRASELQRYLGGARDGHHLELGFAAGGRTTGVFSTATRNVTYRLKAGAPLARPSTRSSPAVALARSCRADQKRDCVTTARKEVAGRCEAECTSKEKRQLCQVKREICDEQTAGIGGSLGQQCKAQLEACLVDEKQDDTSVGACRNSCETRLASERCAG
jgi:hypothetical protein